MALDLLVVLIYAAGMLVLGYYGMRKAKTHEDYLVAGRNLGPTLYMGTMAATVLGGASTVGTVLQVLFGLPFWISVLLGGGVVVVYSTIGGMWSLTLTDIVQFVIKTVGLMFVLLPKP